MKQSRQAFSYFEWGMHMNCWSSRSKYSRQNSRAMPARNTVFGKVTSNLWAWFSLKNGKKGYFQDFHFHPTHLKPRIGAHENFIFLINLKEKSVNLNSTFGNFGTKFGPSKKTAKVVVFKIFAWVFHIQESHNWYESDNFSYWSIWN